jgi:hypothetical protein
MLQVPYHQTQGNVSYSGQAYGALPQCSCLILGEYA